MPEPPLQQFAEAFYDVHTKYPDAPGLPEFYAFRCESETRPCELWHDDSENPEDYPLALALCVMTTLDIIETLCRWFDQWEFQLSPSKTRKGKWYWYINRPVVGLIRDWDDDLPSAALNILRVIGGGE